MNSSYLITAGKLRIMNFNTKKLIKSSSYKRLKRQ